MSEEVKVPAQFGPTYEGNYPAEMRTQLWPLCCGARILSGFKAVGRMTHEELVDQINAIIDNSIPDHQVFEGEQMMPNFVFLTLNNEQMKSNKIMAAVTEAGFKKFAEGRPRGGNQGFFIKDLNGTFKVIAA